MVILLIRKKSKKKEFSPKLSRSVTSYLLPIERRLRRLQSVTSLDREYIKNQIQRKCLKELPTNHLNIEVCKCLENSN